jgi:hypothetical protein
VIKPLATSKSNSYAAADNFKMTARLTLLIAQILLISGPLVFYYTSIGQSALGTGLEGTGRFADSKGN